MKFDRPTPCKSMAGPSRMSLPMRALAGLHNKSAMFRL